MLFRIYRCLKRIAAAPVGTNATDASYSVGIAHFAIAAEPAWKPFVDAIAHHLLECILLSTAKFRVVHRATTVLNTSGDTGDIEYARSWSSNMLSP